MTKKIFALSLILALFASSARAAYWNGIGSLGPYAFSVSSTWQYAAPAADTIQVCSPVPSAGQWAGPFPADLLVHGGALTGGSAAVAGSYTGYSPSWCQLQASWGIVAIAIGYRLQDGSTYNAWPAQLVDVQAAIRYVRAGSAWLHINPNMVGAEGDSAGGSLAEQVGFIGTAIQGDISGDNAVQNNQSNFTVAQFAPWSSNTVNSTITLLPKASAVAAVSYGSGVYTADMLLIQGIQDTLVLPSQSQQAYCLLRDNGRPANYMSFPGGHEYSGISGPSWGLTVGNLQMAAISFIYAHGHYGANPAIPTWVSGPGYTYNNYPLPNC